MKHAPIITSGLVELPAYTGRTGLPGLGPAVQAVSVEAPPGELLSGADFWCSLDPSWYGIFYDVVAELEDATAVVASSSLDWVSCTRPARQIEGLIESIRGRPAKRFILRVYTAASAPAAAGRFVASGHIQASATSDQATRARHDLFCAPGQRVGFALASLAAGGPNVGILANPRGGRIFLSSVVASSATAATLEIRRIDGALNPPILICRVNPDGPISYQATTPRATFEGDALGYIVSSGTAADVSLTMDAFYE